ncbi:hypothetical protein K461DRAFT_276794 [Myriangium duriaei CBS 260.36]|uniref:Uncharacterized protein n=1 Tax=Myriangium duriaei CBS 260.36 TaxID=1168546 RepID=A0A9P4MGL5_9PEZI|nr:hypothetical protein K461DRAFT_276794 [Myriangium duriaei CBS 260.36]
MRFPVSMLIMSVLLLFATPIFAARVTYIGKYLQNNEVKNVIRSERITAASSQAILFNIYRRWSKREYKAALGRRNLLRVYNVHLADTAEDARDLVRDMSKVVRIHTGNRA